MGRAADISHLSDDEQARISKRRAQMLAATQRWQARNPDKVNTWKADNCDAIKRSRVRCRSQVNAYHRNRRATDIQYKLSCRLRVRTANAVKDGAKAGSAVDDLGCSVAELHTYLETLFLAGMTWENWSHKGWHIDHIKPLASFDLTDPVQFRAASHFTNLQPLWAVDNIRKGDSLQ